MLEVFLTEEQKKLREEARDFVKSVPRQYLLDMDADKIKFPKELLQEMGRRRLLGLRCSPRYGGRGLKWVEELLVLNEISKLGIVPACVATVVSIVTEAVEAFGTEEQKQRYIVPTLRGEKYCAEALTEPSGGSDFFFSTTTRAKKENGYYVLRGQKRFIVGGEGADYFLVFAITNPGAGRDAMSAFLVEREMGVEVKHVYGLMGCRGGGVARIAFKDVKVPEENLLGKEGEGGKIFYRIMIPERITSGITGGAREMLMIAARYAMRRKAFGTEIKNFEAVSFKIADSLMKLDAVDAFAYAVARTVDEGVGTPGYRRRLVSELKKFSTQVQWEVINDAMQIVGGLGYTNIFPIERALREARLPLIWTGTNEIQSLIIQHEFFKELREKEAEGRDVEKDVPHPEEVLKEEKVYEPGEP
jgi:alkylation response protein AidB-like acyl-CoA dehydrogenase